MNPRTLKSMLLALMTSVVLLGYGSLSYAQSTDSTPLPNDVEEAMVECDLLLEAMAKTRDDALRETNEVETERDEARGKLLFVVPRLVEVESANQRLQRQVESQPSRLVWAGVGAGVALVAGGVVVWSALAL